MEIPLIGKVIKDEGLGWYYSEPIRVPVLGDQMCQMIVERYDEDSNQGDFHAAIKNFLSINQSVLKDAESDVFQYYKDRNADWDEDHERFIAIESPADVWKHVQLGTKPLVTRRGYGDHGIYISLDCECDWEEEHGLQIVFKNGLKINKIGAYDGHYTNSDAYGDDRLENIIYAQL